MTVTDQIKILDNKIKSNQVQRNFGREAARISAFSSKDLLYEFFGEVWILDWWRYKTQTKRIWKG